MIVEHEFLEQVADDSWTLARSVAFIERHKDPWLVLKRLYEEKCLEFRQKGAGGLADGRVAQIFRFRDLSEGDDIQVTATDLGAERAFGQWPPRP